MKAFRFRGRALLDLRKRLRDAAQVDLARAREAAGLAEQAMTRADVQLRTASSNYLESIRSSARAEELQRHRNWIARQEAVCRSSRRELDERALAVARFAEAVSKRHREVRVLERLRDRMWRRYLDEMRRLEIKEIDQHATLQFARRLSNGGSSS